MGRRRACANPCYGYDMLCDDVGAFGFVVEERIISITTMSI